MNSTTSSIKKSTLSPEYPPEEGCYLRGNDYSPVAVVVILRWNREQTPTDIEKLVQVGVESGAALSGTLQTENIGLEKIILNVVANPNILLYDPGAFPAEAIIGKIAWRVTKPYLEPKDEAERAQQLKGQQLMERIRKAIEEKKRRECPAPTRPASGAPDA